ncbi:MAG: hypothetical protein QGI93_13175 [Planctomycetota bacterium]|nr:hypothetical protein [Candidatus Woesearchaeota archaeon]MDP6387140.1 hypothetical protein [Planctomycetota bacterium]MDP6739078.1 hypothetical protein [Planctomycetota bacterium]MDP6937442.1 hypothetical protein [Planctomycetota bacterium]
MRRLGNAALLGTCVMVAAVAVGGFRGPEDPTEAPPAVAPGQGQRGVWDLLVAIPFRVDEPFTHWWRAERPEVQAGHLLVLAVDPIVVRPRQTAEPILFVGDQTAERVNAGYEDGALIVVVPAQAGDDGWPLGRLAGLPMWFGEPGLPEQVDVAAIREARRLVPDLIGFSEARVEQALTVGGNGLRCQDQAQLYLHAADWIERFAPADRHIVERLRLNR